MLGVPPEVIATEEHSACVPQQCAERSLGVPWRGDELEAFGNRQRIAACDQVFRLRGRLRIRRTTLVEKMRKYGIQRTEETS